VSDNEYSYIDISYGKIPRFSHIFNDNFDIFHNHLYTTLHQIWRYNEYTKNIDFTHYLYGILFMPLVLVFLHSIFLMSSIIYQNLPILHKSWCLAYVYNLPSIVVLLPCLEEANYYQRSRM